MSYGQISSKVTPTMVVATLIALSAPATSHAEARRPAAAASAKLLPDWSGAWVPSGTPERPTTQLIVDPDGAAKLLDNRGKSIFELREPIPYNTQYAAQYEKIIGDLRKTGFTYDNSVECLPLGMPREMIIPFPVEFVIQAKRVVMMFEMNQSMRWIYTDGRKHSGPEDLDPTFGGESIGHWEGDTLVVDTIGIRPDVTFDFTGALHSDALHITERIRRIDDKTIVDQITMEDPKAFTRPWTVTRRLEHHPEQDIKEYVCTNNRVFTNSTASKPGAEAASGHR